MHSRNVCHRFAVLLLSVLTFGLVVLSGGSAVQAADAKVEFTTTFDPAAVRVGEAVVLDIAAKIPQGYHFYTFTKVPEGPLYLKVKIEGDTLEPLTEWFAPAPHVEIDPNFKRRSSTTKPR